jgi:hypothetical protein
MSDLGESLGRRRADALGRRVRPGQGRVAPLELLELPEQAIVFRVRDLGLIVEVVETVVSLQLGGEFVDPLLEGCVPLGSQALISAEWRAILPNSGRASGEAAGNGLGEFAVG